MSNSRRIFARRATPQPAAQARKAVSKWLLQATSIHWLPASTNIIERPNGAVRRVSGRVTRWCDPEMMLRWTTAAFLEAEKGFRRIQGVRDLWVLAVAFGHASSGKPVDANAKAA